MVSQAAAFTGAPAAHAGVPGSSLPSAPQPELDTAQTVCWHRLQGSSLALSKSVGKHRGIAADAPSRAPETHAEISHFSWTSCCARCYPSSSGEGEQNSLLSPKQLIPSPREPQALQRCWASGKWRVATAASSAALYNSSDKPFPPGAVVPDTTPAMSSHSRPHHSLDIAEEVGGMEGRGLSQVTGWPGHASQIRSTVSGEEMTSWDTGASLPYSDAASHTAKAAQVAELRYLSINSFYDAH